MNMLTTPKLVWFFSLCKEQKLFSPHNYRTELC